MKTMQRGNVKKYMVTYEITHEDGATTVLEVTVDFDGSQTMKATKTAGAPGAVKAPPVPVAKPKPIQPPAGLPAGAGWKASRSMSTRSDGKQKSVTTYTVSRPNGTSYEQVVTVEFDGTTSTKKKALLK